MSHYDFFQNRECEYFPCHPGGDPESFSCLFCFCPLYALGNHCGGHFEYTEEGIKDCTNCLRPHRRENYGEICKMLTQVMELAKKPPEAPEKP
ncbi:MAG: cysteine-rich small domain-containing protein [Oscillospiraceae bacterium]|nr:cysteine-rich small domain-containing protein [Oscillospiraceae bacterium]